MAIRKTISYFLGCEHTKLGVNVVPEVESKSLQDNNKKSKSQDMAAISSNLTSLNASATGSGRSKVALKPGHSLMDWIRYTHSGRDLTSTGGKILEVSSRELAKHNTRKDAWIALKGKVYNITPYLDFHPGGEEELMRGAGKDATDLFNQVHRWVNAESMLQKCFVGVLKKSWSLDNLKVTKCKTGKPMKKVKSPKIIPESTFPASPGIESEIVSDSISEWHIISSTSAANGDTSVSLFNESNKIVLRIVSIEINHRELITEFTKENLFIKFNKDINVWLNVRFPDILKNTYEVRIPKAMRTNDVIDLEFERNEESCSVPSKADLKWMLSDRGDKSIFWSCKLVKKIAVNYNTYLFTFLLPPSIKMWIPIGCHVFVKSDIEGVEIVRSYTPVVSLDSIEQNDLSDGSHIILMIKIYPSGTLTPILNMCDIGESVFISNYVGSFSENVLKQYDSVIMLAAGTGITPMIKVISWTLCASDKKRSLLLLFFNKTQEDILWNTEFKKCTKNFENFQVIHILSEPSHKWCGYTGSIGDNILKEVLPEKSVANQLILICGPLPFTNSALKILEKFDYNQEHIHAFTG